MVCTGPITYKGHAQLRADLAKLKAALQGRQVADAFVPAVSPTNVEEWQGNRYYPTQEAFLFAIAEAMREEFRAIVDAGFIHYVNERLDGFEPLGEPVPSLCKDSREVKSFPEFYAWFGRALPSPAMAAPHMVCTGSIAYKGHAQLQADLANL